jgi:hypothetical protein
VKQAHDTGVRTDRAAALKGGLLLSNSLDAIRADQQNFLDKTEDEVKEVPASTNAGEAVEAITAHINKYDEPQENERVE